MDQTDSRIKGGRTVISALFEVAKLEPWMEDPDDWMYSRSSEDLRYHTFQKRITGDYKRIFCTPSNLLLIMDGVRTTEVLYNLNA